MTTDLTTLTVECPCCGHEITVGYVLNEGVDWSDGCSCWDWLDMYGDPEMYETRLLERIGEVGRDDFVEPDMERARRTVGFPGVAR